MDVAMWKVSINLRHAHGPVITVAGRMSNGQILRTGGLAVSAEAGRRVVTQAVEQFADYDFDNQAWSNAMAELHIVPQVGTQAQKGN